MNVLLPGNIRRKHCLYISMNKLLSVVCFVFLINVGTPRLPSSHPAVCVQYLNRQTGICEGQNLGKFDPATDIETTAEEKCCDIFSAGAYYDTVTKSCLSCENVPSYSCYSSDCSSLLPVNQFSGSKHSQLECCDAFEHGGLAAVSVVDDHSETCALCSTITANRYQCFQGSTAAGFCDGAPVGSFDTPEQCCGNTGGLDYEDPSGTCFSCADVGGLIKSACVETSRCNGANLDTTIIFESSGDCCGGSNGGGFLLAIPAISFHYCAICRDPIKCHSDTQCDSLIGSEKQNVEECCESFENGGLGGLYYSIGAQCLSCAAVLDVDECVVTPGVCGGGMCINTIGSYTCVCDDGFELNTMETKCENVDECAQNNPCGSAGTCVDTTGSYICMCLDGYTFSSGNCFDVDECVTNMDNCNDELATCSNTIGSFECASHDIDECTNGPNDCDVNFECVNTLGSFTCDCPTGFEINEGNCEDIDECTNGPNDCDVNFECVNTPGSFTCDCPTGFEINEGNCEDIDECTNGPNDCDVNFECVNTLGSFTCDCPTGFEINEGNCEDIDECTASGLNDCDVNFECVNTPGSFTCDCPTGFEINEGNCEDIDECTNGPNDCDVNFECVNTLGSFTCECPTGFEINEGNCEDINECISGDHNCDEDANFMCSNTPGSFECLCLPGYEMDEEGGCAATQPVPPALLQWIRRIRGRLLGRLLDRIRRPAAEEEDSFL